MDFFFERKKKYFVPNPSRRSNQKNPSRRINFSTNGYLDLPVIVPMGQMK